MKRVAIVIPAYNEENRISKTLKTYLSYFKELKKKKELDFVIIVVLNACKDNTKGVVSGFKDKEIEMLDFKRGGKGFAITEGFKHAIKKNWDLIGFIDADMSTPPSAFYGLVRHINDYDGIIADRWDKKSKITPKQSLVRRFISRIYNMLVRSLFFFNHRDTQCGAKLFRKELLEKIISNIGSSEWGFDVDLLFYVRREKGKVKSIPTEWHDEVGSHINLKKTPVTMFLSAIRLRLIHSPLRFLVRAYTLLPEKLKFHKMI
ncbi:MAG: glycosyltransferase [archaeon]